MWSTQTWVAGFYSLTFESQKLSRPVLEITGEVFVAANIFFWAMM
jgi:hypothetical protein